MPLFKKAGRALSAKLTRVTLDRFIAAHATRLRTLDIGAQNGPYATHFPRRIALDITRGVGVQIIGDAQALGIADACFEIVLCTEVLEHLPEPQRAIDEMFRVLVPGGQLLLTTSFCFPFTMHRTITFASRSTACVTCSAGSRLSNSRKRLMPWVRLRCCCSGSGMQAETLHRQPFRAFGSCRRKSSVRFRF